MYNINSCFCDKGSNKLTWEYIALEICILGNLCFATIDDYNCLATFFFFFYLTSFDHHQKSNFMYTSSFGSSVGLIISVYCTSA